MKLVCVIDNLGSGGAQRQLTTLGVLLKKLGHSVAFITYHRDDFFLPVLERVGIENISLVDKTHLQRPLAIRKALNSRRPDAVLAFLEGPSLYCELAGLPSRKWGLIVSERLQVNPKKGVSHWHRLFHRLADYITTNSHANRLALARLLPGLAFKIVTIYNCLDLDTFRPSPLRQVSKTVRFIVAASYQPRKNPLGFVRALRVALNAEPGLQVQVDWYGGFPARPDGAADRRHLEEARRSSHELGVDHMLHLHDGEADIVSRYQAAAAVLLPSLAEGLPNTVCEGMACGLPVLAGRIGDAGILVQEGVNGFLFDPQGPEDIARALLQFCRLGPQSQSQMGARSREVAEKLFSPAAAVRAYENLLVAAARSKGIRLTDRPSEPATSVSNCERPELATSAK
jgi:glycosyltransferase involved in cell wall biosynthesis